MFQHFLFSNLHFTISVLLSLVFFATGWLYLDSWKTDKHKTILLRGLAFILLAFTVAYSGTNTIVNDVTFLIQALRIVALIVILLSLLREPVLSIPKTSTAAFALPAITLALQPLYAFLYILVGFAYIRKATRGLEKQLAPAGYAFFILGIAEAINTLYFTVDTTFVFWSELLRIGGPAWLLVHVLTVLGILVLGRWVWGYIRFRPEPQLFLIFVTTSLVIFIATTFFFTFLLFQNLEETALDHLHTDAQVLQYSVERLQAEALANANAIANDSAVSRAIENSDKEGLYMVTSDLFGKQKTSFLTMALPTGEVYLHAHDKDKADESVATNQLFQSALDNKPLSTVAIQENVLAPLMTVTAAVPVTNTSDDVIGVVLTGFIIDSTFVDGIKDVTGLDTTIFSNDTRAATTFITADGKSRFVGSKESNPQVIQTVLKDNRQYLGSTNIFNKSFYGAYLPLKSLNDQTIGMLFVGKPQFTLIKTAQRSLELTFLGSIALMVLSLIPSFFIARYLKLHLSA